MINTSIYKSEFQKMIRNNAYDGYVLQEGCDSANEAYLAPSLDREKFNQAMEKMCIRDRLWILTTVSKTENSLSLIHI